MAAISSLLRIRAVPEIPRSPASCCSSGSSFPARPPALRRRGALPLPLAVAAESVAAVAGPSLRVSLTQVLPWSGAPAERHGVRWNIRLSRTPSAVRRKLVWARRLSRGTRIPLRGESERSRPVGGCRDAQRTPSAPTAPTNAPIGLFPVSLQRHDRGATGIDVEGQHRPPTPADRRDLHPGGRSAQSEHSRPRTRHHRGNPALTQLAE